MRLRTVAFGNLRRRSSRAAFLVAGLLIGIATVVTLLTLSRALTVQAQNQLETYGANIVVAPQTDDLSLSYGGVALGGVRLQARDLREADLSRIDTIENRKNVAIVAPELLGAVKVQGGQALLLGVRSKDEFELKKWWRLDGRRPAAGDELVAGSSVARRLGLRIGDTGRPRRPRLHRQRRPAAHRLPGRRAARHRAGRRPGAARQARPGDAGAGRRAVQRLPRRGDRPAARATCCPAPR